jgi:hypothetical protein
MRVLRALTTLFLFASTATSAQGWVEYINKTDLFIVNFPGDPAITETTHHSAYDADFPARVYTVDNERGRYQITVVDYRETEAIHLARTNRTEANSSSSVWITDVQASIANAAQMFRTRGGEVTYDAWADIDKIAGHQLQITNPDQTRSFVSIHLHKSRLYILEGTVPAGAPAPGIFQQSLGVLDEEGRRIRYIMDVDGNLTRMEVMHEWIGVDPELAGDQLIE